MWSYALGTRVGCWGGACEGFPGCTGGVPGRAMGTEHMPVGEAPWRSIPRPRAPGSGLRPPWSGLQAPQRATTAVPEEGFGPTSRKCNWGRRQGPNPLNPEVRHSLCQPPWLGQRKDGSDHDGVAWPQGPHSGGGATRDGLVKWECGSSQCETSSKKRRLLRRAGVKVRARVWGRQADGASRRGRQGWAWP